MPVTNLHGEISYNTRIFSSTAVESYNLAILEEGVRTNSLYEMILCNHRMNLIQHPWEQVPDCQTAISTDLSS